MLVLIANELEIFVYRCDRSSAFESEFHFVVGVVVELRGVSIGEPRSEEVHETKRSPGNCYVVSSKQNRDIPDQNMTTNDYRIIHGSTLNCSVCDDICVVRKLRSNAYIVTNGTIFGYV